MDLVIFYHFFTVVKPAQMVIFFKIPLVWNQCLLVYNFVVHNDPHLCSVTCRLQTISTSNVINLWWIFSSWLANNRSKAINLPSCNLAMFKYFSVPIFGLVWIVCVDSQFVRSKQNSLSNSSATILHRCSGSTLSNVLMKLKTNTIYFLILETFFSVSFVKCSKTDFFRSREWQQQCNLVTLFVAEALLNVIAL